MASVSKYGSMNQPRHLAEKARRGALDFLRNENEGDKPQKITELLVDLGEEGVGYINNIKSKSKNLDCNQGCSYCCHMRTLASPPEVLILADHLRSNFSEATISKLINKLKRTVERVKGLTDAEHGVTQTPCALLEDGKCSVYEMRPLECRGYGSFDVKSCEAAYDDYENWEVPVFIEQYSIFKNLQAGLLMALAASDIEDELLELNSSLLIALTKKDAVENWLAGEKVFSDVALSDQDSAQRAMQPWTPTFT